VVAVHEPGDSGEPKACGVKARELVSGRLRDCDLAVLKDTAQDTPLADDSGFARRLVSMAMLPLL
jgi:hypothetical protein